MKGQVFVSIVVDDLNARDDATRSDRVSGYRATPEEIEQLLALIRVIKKRSGFAETTK